MVVVGNFFAVHRRPMSHNVWAFLVSYEISVRIAVKKLNFNVIFKVLCFANGACFVCGSTHLYMLCIRWWTVEGLTSCTVTNGNEIRQLTEEGDQRRTIAATKLNEMSKSAIILIITSTFIAYYHGTRYSDTQAKANSAVHPSVVDKSSTSLTGAMVGGR